MSKLRIPTVALSAILCVACTKPAAPESSSSGTASTPGAETSETARSPVLLYNAYTSNVLVENGSAGEPTKTFNADDKIYVGAVLHGEASSAAIKAEWSVGGAAPLGSQETSLPVTAASVATVEISKDSPLVPGDYKVLVYLDGKPSWELDITVQE